MSHARVHTVHNTFKLNFFQMTLCNLWKCLQCIEFLLSTSAVYLNVAVSKTHVKGHPYAGGQGRTDCIMIFNARLSSSFPSAMERKEDKNKENTLVNQAKSCKMQIKLHNLHWTKNQCSIFHSWQIPRQTFCLCPFLLSTRQKWYLFTRFSVFLKSNFMISCNPWCMMKI